MELLWGGLKRSLQMETSFRSQCLVSEPRSLHFHWLLCCCGLLTSTKGFYLNFFLAFSSKTKISNKKMFSKSGFSFNLPFCGLWELITRIYSLYWQNKDAILSECLKITRKKICFFCIFYQNIFTEIFLFENTTMYQSWTMASLSP